MGYCRDCEYGKKREEDEGEDYEIPYWVDDRTRYCTKRGKTVSDYDTCDEYEDEPTLCYITTVACKILGLPDDNEYLNILREFRNNVLRTNKEYYKLLVLYDIVGPKISASLLKDKEKEIFAKAIMVTVERACDYIKDNKYNKAINKYYNMTMELAQYYGIEVPEINEKQVEEVDISKSGTGKLVYKIKRT